MGRWTKREEGGAEVQPPSSLTHSRAYTFVVVFRELLQFSNLNPSAVITEGNAYSFPSLFSVSFLAPKHRTFCLSLDWVTCQQEQKSGKARQEKASPGSPRSQKRSPVPELSNNSGRRCPRTGEAGLAVWSTESPAGWASRSSHCTLVWRRRRSARLEGESDGEAEVQRDRETHKDTGDLRAEAEGGEGVMETLRETNPERRTETSGDRNAAQGQMRKADADTPRAEGEGTRQSGARGSGSGARRAYRTDPRADDPRAPLHLFLRSGSPTRSPSPGPDVSQRGANELQDLNSTSPERAAIGWPSRRGGLLPRQLRLALGRNGRSRLSGNRSSAYWTQEPLFSPRDSLSAPRRKAELPQPQDPNSSKGAHSLPCHTAWPPVSATKHPSIHPANSGEHHPPPGACLGSAETAISTPPPLPPEPPLRASKQRGRACGNIVRVPAPAASQEGFWERGMPSWDLKEFAR